MTVIGYTKTQMDTLLAAKAPLASPALTGNPTAPTPTAGDNDTSIATTAFVTTAVAAGGGGGSGTLTSFQGRTTAAAVLTKADVTGTALAASDVSAVATSAVAAASGVASLDASVHLPLAQVAAGATLTVAKDVTTGFWPASYAANGTPVYTSGSASTGVRPTSRADVYVIWKGADPSPAIVASGTAGMRDNLDMRFVT